MMGDANQKWRCPECGETVYLRSADLTYPTLVYCPECTTEMDRTEVDT